MPEVTYNGHNFNLSQDEFDSLAKIRKGRQKSVFKEFVFFRAAGTFNGSRPNDKSPYQTAGPFYSSDKSTNLKLLWPADTTLKSLHDRLSRALNDRHNKTGELGGWRETHAKIYGGHWSFRYQHAIRIRAPSNYVDYTHTNPDGTTEQRRRYTDRIHIISETEDSSG